MAVWIWMAGANSVAEKPFWKTKERVYSRIQNREVIVSVSSKPEPSGPKHRLVIAGGGQVAAPCGYVFQSAQEYENVARATGYVERVSFASDTGVLDLRLAAYGLKSDIAFKLTTGEQKLHYDVIKGPLKGMNGEFTFDSPATKACDVGLHGEFSYEKFPIPEFFLRFGLEVILQRMAIAMRVHTEKKFKNDGPSK